MWFLDEIKAKAKSGDAESQYELGHLYILGDYVGIDYGKALKLIKRSADKNYLPAIIHMGVIYEHGIYGFLAIDDSKAFKWHLKSAKYQVDTAEFKVGVCYENGYGVKKSWIKADKWYKLAAEHGNHQATILLSSFKRYDNKDHQNGRGEWARYMDRKESLRIESENQLRSFDSNRVTFTKQINSYIESTCKKLSIYLYK